MINYKEKLDKIRAFVFDFDGVMTNGDVWVYADREGYIIAVISGATSASIDNRMAMLGVTQCYTGCGDKIHTYNKFLTDNGLKEEEVLCMGDDLPDYPMLKRAGVSACPADAAVEIKEMVDYVSHCEGGKGCVRDVIEQVLRLHGKWFHEDAVVW